jgi:hypothetical protein
MFNGGIRGKRANDNQGTISPQSKFVQSKNPQPYISGYAVSGSDDTALDPAGGQTVLVNGTGFATGVSATLAGTQIGSVTLVSPTQISFTSPAKAGGSYSLVVYNTTGGAAILVPGLTYSSIPTFTTSAGSIGSYYETTAISTSVTATSDSAITYSLSSGSLPSGATLNSDGTITGTSPVDSSSTTYTFDIKATDAELQDVTRTFTLTINTDVVSWVSPADNTTYSLVGNQAMANVTLNATSAAGYNVSYTANALPTGVTLSGNTISGTPTVAAATSTLLTATSATTSRSATRTVSWTVSLGDTYWKNVSLLLSGTTPTTSFINDASLNNSQITIAGDTKPNKLNPYQGNGYYGVSHSATPDYLSVPHNSNFSLTSGQTDTFIIEGWFYFNVVTAQTSLFDKSGVNGVSFANWTVYLNASSQIQLQWGVSGSPGTSTVGLIGSTFVPVAGTWYHIAFVKSNADWAVFANGTRIISYNGLNTAGDANPSTLKIGFGIQSSANSAYFNGYISNVRAWRGTSGAPYSATSTTLTVPTSPLTAIAGTTLLTHQSSRFVDVSSGAATVTATGANIKVSPAIPFAANSTYATYGSAYFDNNGDYLSTPSNAAFTFGTGNFTVEAWVYITAYNGSTYEPVFANSYLFYIGGTGKVLMYNGTADVVAGTAGDVPIGSWNHVAWVRNGTTVTIYVNGVAKATGTVSASIATASPNLIGNYSTNYFPGYIADVRVNNTTALYTTTFTPPTAPLTAVANTSLLTLQYNGGATNNGFVDQSSFNNIITRNGNTTQGTFSPYSQTGWSTYFGTTAMGFQTPASSLTSIIGTSTLSSTSTFTIEAWINPLSRHSGGGAALGYVAGSMNITGPQADWGFGPDSTGKLTVWWWNGSSIVQATSTNAVPLHNWTHIATTITSGAIKIFINGNLETLTGTTTVTTVSASQSTFTVGGYTYASTTWQGFNGYISNLRVVKSALYSATFTPSTTLLTSIANTSLLTFQNNRVVDNSFNGYTLTPVNTPSVQAYSPFGGVTSVPTSYSNYFDGTGDYLSMSNGTPVNFGTNNFTIEGWFYTTSLGAVQTPFAINLSGSGSSTCIFTNITTGGVFTAKGYSGGTVYTTTAPSTLAVNTWYHFAIVRNGTSLDLYVNGTKGTSDTPGSNSLNGGSTYVTMIGAGYTSGTTVGQFFTGYISNIRIINGTALYTTTFTPSTTPLTTTSQGATASQVSLLTCQSSTMVDNSTNYVAITANGDTKPYTFNPFGMTNTTQVAYSPSVNGGSMYFDGTGDYLTAPYNPAYELATGNFTIEFWMYKTTTGDQYIVHNRPTSSATGFAVMTYSDTIRFYFTGGTSVNTTATITLNQWYHIALVNTDGTMKIYFNGEQKFSGSVGTGSTTSPTNLFIGCDNGPSFSSFFNGYLSDLKITKAALYSASFVPGVAPATPTTTIGTSVYSSSILLNGTIGGIIDYHVTNNLETVGNTQLASEDPYSGSYYSNYFNGSTDCLSIPASSAFSIATNTTPFTIECWVNLASSTVQQYIFSETYSTDAVNLAAVFNNGSSSTPDNVGLYPVLGYYTGSAWAVSAVSSTAITLGAWYHIAYVFTGSTTKIFINGVDTTAAGAATTWGGTLNSNGVAWNIGRRWDTSGGSGSYTNGSISNFRFVKGTAVYTSNFTPSTIPLTSITNTMLLTCQSNKFVDNSTNAITLTPVGTPKVKSMNPFQQNTGKSLYFDGTGDWLSIPTNPNMMLNTGDFTIEGWIYKNATSTTMCLVDLRNAASSNIGISVLVQNTGLMRYVYGATGASVLASTTVIPEFQWVHIAVTRSSNTVKLFINGVQEATTVNDTTNYNVNAPCLVGSNIGNTSLMNGYIKDLRITKGVARYTATFTPPTSPYETK